MPKSHPKSTIPTDAVGHARKGQVMAHTLASTVPAQAWQPVLVLRCPRCGYCNDGRAPSDAQIAAPIEPVPQPIRRPTARIPSRFDKSQSELA